MTERLRLLQDPIERSLELIARNKNSAVIPLAWPELTARAPEKIWEYLRRARIVKNINFKVGHAAMVVALDSEFMYFDFGRYITPLGYGRTRSAETDPKLILNTKPEWSDDGQLRNLEELCQELENIKIATHGDGPMFASIHYESDIVDVLKYVKNIIEQGYVRYRAFNTNDSNCARFVAKSLLAGWAKKSIYKSRFRIPVTLAPTPYFNVVAATSNGKYIIWENGQGIYLSKHHNHALKDIFVKSLESFYSNKAKKLPADHKPGMLHQPDYFPENIDQNYVYLGGIGEAAWHKIIISDDEAVKISRHYYSGEFEFEAEYRVSTDWIEKLRKSNCQLVHDTHFCWLTLQCKTTGEKQRFYRKIA